MRVRQGLPRCDSPDVGLCCLQQAGTIKLGGRFGYFLFFSARGRGRGIPRRREGGGERFFTENPRRGVCRVGWGGGGGGGGRGAARVFARNLGGEAKYFFSGLKFPPSKERPGHGIHHSFSCRQKDLLTELEPNIEMY